MSMEARASWRSFPFWTEMMRASVAPNRTSSAAGPSSQPSAAALSKLVEKKKEYDAVSALEKASALFLERIDGLGDDCDTMADAGEGAPLQIRSTHGVSLNQRLSLSVHSVWAGSGAMAENVRDPQPLSSVFVTNLNFAF